MNGPTLQTAMSNPRHLPRACYYRLNADISFIAAQKDLSRVTVSFFIKRQTGLSKLFAHERKLYNT